MSDMVRQLVDSLLYEGYALYPYTPGATKNATPTPFGIVYPPVYAAECPGAFDHARLECVAEPAPGATVTATPALPETRPASATRRARSASRWARCRSANGSTVKFSGGRITRALGLQQRRPRHGSLLRAQRSPGRLAGSAAPRRSGTRSSRPRFCSRSPAVDSFLPLESGGDSVNTYPVLTGERDETVLGTTIVLPDHPQLAPESRGGLFDSTEIEEALLLHVQVLSDSERAEIEQADPAVREMVARAAAATPEDIMALHGRVTVRDPVSR